MFTKQLDLYNTPCKGILTREKLKKIVTVSFSQGQGKGTKHPKQTIKNVCCYCNQTRKLSRVRDFYVCKKHLAAWGIA